MTLATDPQQRRRRRLAALALGGAATAASAAERFVFLTNWYAQAEHGGFYQAIATGLYQQAGLDLTLKMGGPQVNVVQLLAAGQADCIMGSSDLRMLQARANGVPLVTVAAMFQKDPQALIAHEDVRTFEAMRGKTILISADGRLSYWPWLKQKYGFSDAQARPYTFNVQPFVADPEIVQQGYVTSEPFAIRKAGVAFNALLLSDHGYPAYSTTVTCMDKTVRARRAALAAFVKASVEGWKSYLADPAPGNALIRKDNPAMSEAQLNFGVAQIKVHGLVGSGDAMTQGIGIITDRRARASYDFLVGLRLIDPAKLDFAASYTTDFVKDVRVMP